VLLLTDQSGGVEVWDLLDRSHVPVLRTAAASSALSSLSLAMVALPGSGAAALQLLAVGDSAGTLRILELPRSLRRQVGVVGAGKGGCAAGQRLVVEGHASVYALRMHCLLHGAAGCWLQGQGACAG
jgi:hypothetical protein